MHRKGTLERVFCSDTPNGRFWQPNESNGHSGICFDGSLVWAACYDPSQDTRLIVIDPATKQVSEITAEQGLPNSNAGNAGPNRVHNLLSLAPLSPGRILVAGGFGRGWLAEVEFKSGSGGKVRIFHEAKESLDGGNREQWRSTAVSFRPGNIFPLTNPQRAAGDSKRFLVGRIGPHPDLLAHPLVVDPKNGTVEACAEQIWSQIDVLRCSPLNDSVYFVNSLPPRHETIGLQRLSGAELKLETIAVLPREGYVLAEPDRVHVVGRQWWIVNLTTRKVTPAGPVPWRYLRQLAASGPDDQTVLEPNPSLLRMLARSNHYGIIAYHSGGKNPQDAELVQVTFTE